MEQAAAAAESLEEQAQNLSTSVSVFKLDASVGMGAARVAPAKHAPAPHRPAVKHAPVKPRRAEHADAGSDEWQEF